MKNFMKIPFVRKINPRMLEIHFGILNYEMCLKSIEHAVVVSMRRTRFVTNGWRCKGQFQRQGDLKATSVIKNIGKAGYMS